MNRKIIHHEKRSQERKKTNKTRPGQETAKRTREAARAVLNTIVCETALFPFSAWPRVLCASRVQPLISTDAGLSRCQVDDKWFGQPCFIFPRPPPPNATNAGRPFGRRRPSRASSQPTTRCGGRRRPAGRRPRAFSLAGDSDRPRRGPRRGGRSSRDVGRARFASLQISDALLFGASTRASSAVRALVARRPPASERRVSRAAGTSLARRVRLSYAVYIPAMTHFHQPRGRMVAYTRGEEFLATRRSRVRISPVPKPKK